jgi:hypothetical protein
MITARKRSMLRTLVEHRGTLTKKEFRKKKEGVSDFTKSFEKAIVETTRENNNRAKKNRLRRARKS